MAGFPDAAEREFPQCGLGPLALLLDGAVGPAQIAGDVAERPPVHSGLGDEHHLAGCEHPPRHGGGQQPGPAFERVRVGHGLVEVLGEGDHLELAPPPHPGPAPGFGPHRIDHPLGLGDPRPAALGSAHHVESDGDHLGVGLRRLERASGEQARHPSELGSQRHHDALRGDPVGNSQRDQALEDVTPAVASVRSRLGYEA